MTAQTKAVIVTGAASGIGRAACERLATSGWQVLAVDRDAQRLAWAAEAAIASYRADVADEADNAGMVAEAFARFGRLDAAVLNAGVTGGGQIDTMPLADMRRVLDINLVGAILGVRAVLPALRAAGGGAIAVTASTMGLAGDSDNFAYAAAKHGVIGMVRAVAREVGWQGIRINALCPGITHSGMTAAVGEVAPELERRITAAVPLQRWARPDEMAAVLEFLVSPASSYVSGHALVADAAAMVGTGIMPPTTGAARVVPAELD